MEPTPCGIYIGETISASQIFDPNTEEEIYFCSVIDWDQDLGKIRARMRLIDRLENGPVKRRLVSDLPESLTITNINWQRCDEYYTGTGCVYNRIRELKELGVIK
jgi:hypothetical protein